ncbi:MAG: hypothetical protein AAGC64_13965 [Bacteroidota bacterium]
MNYNKKHIDIQVGLINSFLFEVSTNILDVSYTVLDNQLIIQVVLIEGENLDSEIKDRVLENLIDFEVDFKLLNISKEKYNANKGNWNPIEYDWLDNLLFSKAEQL